MINEQNADYIKLSGTTSFVSNRSRGPGSSHYRGFTIKLLRTTVGRTPLDE
jgi:hypothetical protein